jgi:hypothetical protein
VAEKMQVVKLTIVRSSTLTHLLPQLAKIHQAFRQQSMEPLEDLDTKKNQLFAEEIRIMAFLKVAILWKTMNGFLLLA